MPSAAPIASADPATQAIAESKAAYEAFLNIASQEHFEPQAAARAAAINPVGDAIARAQNQLSTAAQQATGVLPHQPTAQPQSAPRSPDGRFASPAQSPSTIAAPAAISGPPRAATAPAVPVQAGQSSPQGQALSPGPAAAPADPFADVPSVDAFDNPARALPKGNDWRRLHAKTDHYVQQTTQLQQQIEQLRAASAAPAAPPKELVAQLTTLQAEREALQAKLEAVAVERSPRFEAMFKPRMEAAKLAATQAAGEHADKVKALIEMPDSGYRNSQLNTILKELEPGSLEANKLMMAVASLDQIATERNAMAAQSATLYKQWQSEEQQMSARQMQQRQSAVSTTFESTVAEWKAAGAAIDDNDVALAKDVFTGNRTLQDIARAAMWVAAGPKAAAQALSLQEQLNAANAELAKLRGVQPGTSADTGLPHQDNSAIEVAVKQGMYSDAIIQAAAQQGLNWR